MRTREKERIFKRFMDGYDIVPIATEIYLKKKYKKSYRVCRKEVEQAIRDVINAKEKKNADTGS